LHDYGKAVFLSIMPLDPEALKQIKELLSSELAPLKTSIKTIETTLSRYWAPEADDLAKHVTVALQTEKKVGNDVSYETQGHGLLICGRIGKDCGGDGKHEEEEQEDVYFFLSAAHVIVRHCRPTENKSIRLKWNCGDAAEHSFSVQRIFLDKRYVADGSYDIGLAVVEPTNATSAKFTKKPVKISTGSKIGHVATGHGLIFLRGNIILEQIDGSARAMINAISVPGCSGCPLFTHQEKPAVGNGETVLYAFLHGYSKHRHSIAKVSEASAHLFADQVLADLSLLPVSNEKKVQNALMKAEDLTIDDAADSKEEYTLFQDDCPEIITSIAQALELPFIFGKLEKFSIESIMNTLTKEAFNSEEDPMALFRSNFLLQCLIPSQHGSEDQLAESGTGAHESGAVISPEKGSKITDK